MRDCRNRFYDFMEINVGLSYGLLNPAAGRWTAKGSAYWASV